MSFSTRFLVSPPYVGDHKYSNEYHIFINEISYINETSVIINHVHVPCESRHFHINASHERYRNLWKTKKIPYIIIVLRHRSRESAYTSAFLVSSQELMIISI